MPQQHEEDNHDRHDEGAGNLRASLVVGLILTTVFNLHTLGYLEVGQTLHNLLGHDTIVLTTIHLGHHSNGAQTVAMTDLAILPVGNHFGKLAQRDAGQETATVSYASQGIKRGG